jgi:D-xylulose reductase
MGNPNVNVDMFVVICKELVLKGSFRYGVSSLLSPGIIA